MCLPLPDHFTARSITAIHIIFSPLCCLISIIFYTPIPLVQLYNFWHLYIEDLCPILLVEKKLVCISFNLLIFLLLLSYLSPDLPHDANKTQAKSSSPFLTWPTLSRAFSKHLSTEADEFNLRALPFPSISVCPSSLPATFWPQGSTFHSSFTEDNWVVGRQPVLLN